MKMTITCQMLAEILKWEVCLATEMMKRMRKVRVRAAKSSRRRNGGRRMNSKLRPECWLLAAIGTSTMMCSDPFTIMVLYTTADLSWTRISKLQIPLSLLQDLFASFRTDTRLFLRGAHCAWIDTTDVKWAQDWLAQCLTSMILTIRQITLIRTKTKKNCPFSSCLKVKAASYPTQ